MTTKTAFITTGNGKTGIDSANLLAGDKESKYNGAIPTTDRAKAEYEKRGLDVSKVCGTCSGNCPGCYAKKETRYTWVMIRYAENTLFAMTDPAGYVADIEKQLFGSGNGPELFRIHDSGDFFNFEYFSAWVEMIKRHPGTQFGAYTKEKEIVEKYGIDNLPDNFSLQCSPWPGFCEPIGDLPQFCYDDGSDPELAKLHHCPAVDKNGKRTGVQCVNCKHCYNAKRGQRWAVYAHS